VFYFGTVFIFGKLFMSLANQSVRIARSTTRAILALGVLGIALHANSSVAKDLFVSTGGSDSVSYASNSSGAPWKTIEHGLYNLKAGDHLYVRGGTYTPRYPVWLSSDYNRQTKGGDPAEVLTATSGTASQPVIIENYQGEAVTVDLANITGTFAVYINLDNKSYWTFRGLSFINSMVVFKVGEDYTTTNNAFDNLKITANRGGDNAAGIHLVGSNAEHTTITNCTIKGPGSGSDVSANTGAVYVKGVNYLKVLNNVLSDAPIGLYYKHRNSATSAGQADVEVAYNYFMNTSRSSLEYNGSFTSIHDNVFGANTAAAHFGDANGSAGADYNKILHNTFFAGSIRFDSAVESGDPFPGVVGNTVTDNIVLQPIENMAYTGATNTNVIGRNLFKTNNLITSFSNLVRMVSDAIFGTPVFVGGSSPTSVSGFALASGSPGKNAATDGRDMGADVSKVLAGKASTTPVPMPPTSVIAQ
jgi:hypothetical protein